jgi:hypothetical protein
MTKLRNNTMPMATTILSSYIDLNLYACFFNKTVNFS